MAKTILDENDKKELQDQINAIPESDPKGTVDSEVSKHNISATAHNDLRLAFQQLLIKVNNFLDSDDTTLDQLSEMIEYIKDNRELIESVTTNKVSVSDIVNDLVTNVTNKPLSAAQGVVLKGLIDAISVPTKLSDLTGDSTHRTVTDAEKTAWNTKSNFDGKYSSLEGKPTIPTVPTNVSAFTNDIGYLKGAELNSAVNTALAQAKASGEFNGKDYILTEADKTEISQTVIEILGGSPVIGIVGENNIVTLTGRLPDGTYTLKYEKDDGSTVDIGDLVLRDKATYSITNNLTNCANSNNATSIIEGSSYSAVITANTDHKLASVVVTMGGVDITSSAVSNGVINIADVTGNIVITANAVVEQNNLADPTSSEWMTNKRYNSSNNLIDITEAQRGDKTFVITNLMDMSGATNSTEWHIKNLDMLSNVSGGHYSRVYFYDSNKNYLRSWTSSGAYVDTYLKNSDYDSNVKIFTNIRQLISQMTTPSDFDNATYISFGGILTGTANDVIITKDAQIK